MKTIPDESLLLIVQNVKQACILAAQQGYENAAISGLCHEGAVEASISQIRMVDENALVNELSELSKTKT